MSLWLLSKKNLVGFFTVSQRSKCKQTTGLNPVRTIISIWAPWTSLSLKPLKMRNANFYCSTGKPAWGLGTILLLAEMLLLCLVCNLFDEVDLLLSLQQKRTSSLEVIFWSCYTNNFRFFSSSMVYLPHILYIKEGHNVSHSAIHLLFYVCFFNCSLFCSSLFSEGLIWLKRQKDTADAYIWLNNPGLNPALFVIYFTLNRTLIHKITMFY